MRQITRGRLCKTTRNIFSSASKVRRPTGLKSCTKRTGCRFGFEFDNDGEEDVAEGASFGTESVVEEMNKMNLAESSEQTDKDEDESENENRSGDEDEDDFV